MRTSTKITAVIGGVALTIATAGVAFAYWTTSGTGTGSASTGTTSAVVVNQTTPPIGLYPGGSSALSGTFTNTANPGAVYITAVTATVDTFSVQTDNSKPACTQADFSISGASNTPGSVANGTAIGAWNGLSLVMANTGLNQDNCKSITVPLTFSAS